MVKRIVWTETALKARREILEYWIKHNNNKSYSKKLSSGFKARTQYIAQYNYLGKSTDYKDIRVTFVEHFSIFYRINKVKN